MTTNPTTTSPATTDAPAGRLTGDAASLKAYLLGGEAIFSAVSAATGARFTFKVIAADDGRAHFVRVLTGSANDDPRSWTFLGTVFDGARWNHSRKSPIGDGAGSARAWRWVWLAVAEGAFPEDVELYHDGRCARCRRLLTVPSSVSAGLGPECARKDRRAAASEIASLEASVPAWARRDAGLRGEARFL